MEVNKQVVEVNEQVVEVNGRVVTISPSKSIWPAQMHMYNTL